MFATQKKGENELTPGENDLNNSWDSGRGSAQHHDLSSHLPSIGGGGGKKAFNASNSGVMRNSFNLGMPQQRQDSDA